MVGENQESYVEALTRRERLRQWGHRASVRASTIEARYLSLLRFSMLLIATVLLIGAIVFVLMGATKQIGSSQVSPEPVKVSAADLAPAVTKGSDSGAKKVDAEKPFQLSSQLKSQTLAAYKSNFAKFERKDEKASEKQILDAVWPQARREAFDNVNIDYVDDEGRSYTSGEELALHALALVKKSSETPDFTQSLQTYRAAKKSRVCRDVTRERERSVSYWDSDSMDCDNWYYSPVGCRSNRMVAEPYTAEVCEMQFPDDLDSPATAMGNSIDRFLRLAQIRQEDAAYKAEEKTAKINQRKVTGRANLMDGGKIFLGFLALMFLYLLVVLERHHRLLRKLVRPEQE
jgi:hypothetical protein